MMICISDKNYGGHPVLSPPRGQVITHTSNIEYKNQYSVVSVI